MRAYGSRYMDLFSLMMTLMRWDVEESMAEETITVADRKGIGRINCVPVIKGLNFLQLN